MNRVRHDGVLVVGAGLAGLSAALEAARAGARVLVVTPEPLLSGCSSAWAQGGMAAALTAADSPVLHARDTEAAGAGLVEAEAARALTDRGRETVEWLAALGAPFDRDADGGFVVSLEAAHSVARVARVGGDGAGRAILSAVVTAVRAEKAIEVWEDARLTGLLQDETGRVVGAAVGRGGAGRRLEIVARAVVLATGGAGGLYAATTTPGALKGEGMALAALAGAEILDPEFVQFHPTAMDVGLDPAPLATEALRGEGARLIDGAGRFLLGQAADADLKPRDVVARAVHAARMQGRGAFLDARAAVGEAFPHEFPAVFAACLRSGLDPRVSPIPVMAACHYHMGGIAAEVDGRTSLAGLYAVGECAATGVHGANRLASNSLLEAAAFGRGAGRAAAAQTGGGRPRPAPRLADLPEAALAELRAAMTDHVGVVRDAAGLSGVLALIDRLEAENGPAAPLIAARLVVQAALDRRESRGGHYRSDYPETAAEARRTRVRLTQPEMLAAE
ncbi:MAG: L-aspartate oxidase [Brevundimonas sp.]|uniref:L-aspartate oxidase n=1 Tax=Brevundimonas albigilva TaxID=1312364 RepID=A0ABY4SR32_9CAUL|nr:MULTISPECIES: L-aspartate oxidase [Brevundimonas]PZU61482.1 MAG: L-aspartate oxidase [Brevundimonas sp.]UQV18819.1 L-aspartate oxidase [Brevundimonas albigilva]URI16384.1 L-aspartate oxidase [Brevundimonas albigilva]